MNMHHFSLFTLSLLCSYVSSYLINHRIARQTGFNYCQTPNNQWGKCVTLDDCPHLREVFTTRIQEPDTPNFLRRSYCGSVENKPKYCCSILSSQNPPVTQPSASITPSTPQTGNRLNNKQPSKKKDYSVCGRSNRNSVNIIGGKDAALGDWPWMVAIGYRTLSNPGPQFRCGGSLISDKWVLTAGHCVVNIGTSNVTVARVGDLDLNEYNVDGATPTDVPIDEIIPHPQFVSSPLLNDIALLRLKEPVTFTALIRPICLPKLNEHKTDQFYDKKVPYIAGWGYTQANQHSSRSNILLEAQVDIVDRNSCIAKYKFSPINSSLIDHRVLCASRRGVDSCQGDSGGPLIIPIKASYYLVGIVSYGIGCANPFYPGVYTRVAQYFDWIKSTTGLEF